MAATPPITDTTAIRELLRLPSVPRLCSDLADERALAACWEAIAPALELRAFEEAADDLRARAARVAVELGCPLIETQLEWAGYDVDEIDEIRAAVDLFHYQNAKLLLVAASLTRALDGGGDAGRPSSRALMRLPRGLPEEMPPLELVPEDVDGELGNCLGEIRTHIALGYIPDDFRALARWPRYLELAWADARKRDADPRARDAVEQLCVQADSFAAQLPRLGKLTRAALRAAEADPRKVRELLTRHRKALAGTVLDFALFKVQLDGAEDAVDSPYPVEWEYLSSDDYLPDDLDGEVRLRLGDPTSLD